MSSEIELLRSLDDEPPIPSTVDVGGAVESGRRRNRRRGLGYAGVAVLTTAALTGVAVSGVSSPKTPAKLAAKPSVSPSFRPTFTIPGTPGWTAPAAPAPTSCTVAKLPMPAGVPMAIAGAADPSGQYVVGRTYPKGGGYVAALWHGDKITKVDLPGDLEENLSDVNSAGTAVGWSFNAKGEVPFVYVAGKARKLAGPANGSAQAINNAGAIVGSDSVGGPRAASNALLWPSATAKPIKLPVPAGVRDATASDIDEDGTTVGHLDLKTPYVWFPDGTHRKLPLPTYQGKTAVAARAFSIRNGIAIGVADEIDGAKGPGKGQMWAVKWNVRTGEATVLDGFDMRPDAINAQGWMVGIDKSGYAILSAGGAPIRLPMIADHKPGDLTNIPNAISDDGRTIVGQSDNANGVIQAVKWTCH
ncbi:hypothetical protein GCM10010172_49890 [Paractinoplanes ferrugineus]|uniref:Uncharacterized protein n=1 Tax=Paractinoplanes ferrugineus TaxID=113564 RepID=A0A919J8Y8_9ACTN|nr:hypothetical protein [Actinoplanes ferrugineus]GIE15749.1 hypothetical protein Afe05nite_75890 [Actinoplanes ferrugineus]